MRREEGSLRNPRGMHSRWLLLRRHVHERTEREVLQCRRTSVVFQKARRYYIIIIYIVKINESTILAPFL